jgi:hypothetical protein
MGSAVKVTSAFTGLSDARREIRLEVSLALRSLAR